MTHGTRRQVTAALAGALLGATTLLTAPATPAAAAPTDSDTLVFVPFGSDLTTFVRNGQVTTASYTDAGYTAFAGDFSAATGTDVFVYQWGDHPDGIIHVEPTGTGVTPSFAPETVRGFYEPFVGDFDGNGIDDVFWYGEGATIDTIWLYQPDGSHEIAKVNVNGAYQPVAGDFDGDGDDDIVWYGPGAVRDSMWVFGEGTAYAVRTLTVGGEYLPLVGHFGGVPAAQEQLIWYAPDGPDSMWTFTTYGKVSRSLHPVDSAEPVVGDFQGTGRDSVFWYQAGTGPEALTSFNPEGVPSYNPAPQVNGGYRPVAGDFDGDGDDGIAWTLNGEAFIWSFDGESPNGYTQTYVDTGQWDSSVIVAHPTVNVD